MPPSPGGILPNASSSVRRRSSGWCHHHRHENGRERVVESRRDGHRSRRWPRRRLRRRNDEQAVVRGERDGEGIDLPRIFVIGVVSAANVARARERGGHCRWRLFTLWYVGRSVGRTFGHGVRVPHPVSDECAQYSNLTQFFSKAALQQACSRRNQVVSHPRRKVRIQDPEQMHLVTFLAVAFVATGTHSFVHPRDLGEVNAYFASSEEGGWEDLSAAGCEQSFRQIVSTYFRVVAFVNRS